MRTRVVVLGLCATSVVPAAAQSHRVGDFLTPGIILQVERQLEHTRDEDGRPLPGWYPQPWVPPIRITVTEPAEVRLQQVNSNLDRIFLPKLSFKDTPVADVVKELRAAMPPIPPKLEVNRLRPDEIAPVQDENVNVALKLSPGFDGPRTLTLEIEPTTARKALEQVAGALGVKLIVEPFGVSLTDQ
jgi:hypothetical protein